MITLRPFEPADQEQAKHLILAGLVEHWGSLDETANPDLDDIATSYANGHFIVACDGDELVGTGVLIPLGRDEAGKITAEIVRMSVAGNRRRQGIGRLILDALCTKARNDGVERLILETTASWTGVINFYQRYGFQITHYEDSPYGRDVYFELELDLSQ